MVIGIKTWKQRPRSLGLTRVACTLAASVFLAFPGPAWAQCSRQPSAIGSVVHIRAKRCDTVNVAYAQGVFVGRNELLTVLHAIPPGSCPSSPGGPDTRRVDVAITPTKSSSVLPETFKKVAGPFWKSDAVWVDRDRDLILLRVQLPEGVRLPVACISPDAEPEPVLAGSTVLYHDIVNARPGSNAMDPNVGRTPGLTFHREWSTTPLAALGRDETGPPIVETGPVYLGPRFPLLVVEHMVRRGFSGSALFSDKSDKLELVGLVDLALGETNRSGLQKLAAVWVGGLPLGALTAPQNEALVINALRSGPNVKSSVRLASQQIATNGPVRAQLRPWVCAPSQQLATKIDQVDILVDVLEADLARASAAASTSTRLRFDKLLDETRALAKTASQDPKCGSSRSQFVTIADALIATYQVRADLGALLTLWTATRSAIIQRDERGANVRPAMAALDLSQPPPAQPEWRLLYNFAQSPLDQMVLRGVWPNRNPTPMEFYLFSAKAVYDTDPCPVIPFIKSASLDGPSLPNCSGGAARSTWQQVVAVLPASTTWLDFGRRLDHQASFWAALVSHGWVNPVKALSYSEGIDIDAIAERIDMLEPTAPPLDVLRGTSTAQAASSPAWQNLGSVSHDLTAAIAALPANIVALDGKQPSARLQAFREFFGPQVIERLTFRPPSQLQGRLNKNALVEFDRHLSEASHASRPPSEEVVLLLINALNAP